MKNLGTDIIQKSKYMLVIMVACCMSFMSSFKVQAASSGKIPCSEGSLSYSLVESDEEGYYTLHIRGAGTPNMSNTFWHSYWEKSLGEDVMRKVNFVVITARVTLVDYNAQFLFYNFEGLESISGLSNVDVSSAKSTYSMFRGCSSLKSLELSNFDTRNVETMNNMFYECSSLTSLDLSNFDTGKVLNMDFMFSKCTSLQKITFGQSFTMDALKDSNVLTNCIYTSCDSLTTIVKKGNLSIYLPNYSKSRGNTYANWVGENDEELYDFGDEATVAQTYSAALAEVKLIFHDASNGEDKVETLPTISKGWVIDTFIKPGYDFVGCTDVNGNSFKDFEFEQTYVKFNRYFTYKDMSYMIDGVDVYCQWTPTTYYITYKNTSGATNPNVNYFTCESAMITLVDAEKEGYTFLGWYSDSDCTKKVTEIASGTKKNINLYAKWQCNHINTKLENYKEATCCEEGYSGDEYCTSCNTYISRGSVTEATGNHKETIVTGAKEATCQNEGNTGNEYCKESGKLILTGAIVSKKNHDCNVLKNQKTATCTEDGYTGDKCCSMCGKVQEEGSVIPKLGHSWGVGVITKQPTESSTGIRTYTCSVCGETKEEILPVVDKTCSHESTEVKNSLEPTCKREGYTGDVYCKDCGILISTGNSIEKVEHTWDNGVVTKEPTNTETGEKTYTCLVCGDVKTSIIPAKGKQDTTEYIPDSGKEVVVSPEGNTDIKDNSSSTESIINSAKAQKVTVKSAKNVKGKKIKITLKKVKGYKYQIKVSTSKNFKKGVKTYTTSKTTYTLKKLKKGKTYYIKTRTYKVIDKVKVYGKWSKVKRVKIKK